MTKSNYQYEKNKIQQMSQMSQMSYSGSNGINMKGISGIGGVSSPSYKSEIQLPKDIFIFKIPVSKLETGYSTITPPVDFELFNISYSANEIDNPVARTIFAIYTFTRIKNKLKKMEI